MPDRRHAADDGGADQHHDEGPALALEHADHALVAGEQPGTPRAVTGFTENSSPGTWIMRSSLPAQGMWMRW
jgi:hypothetical protein